MRDPLGKCFPARFNDLGGMITEIRGYETGVQVLEGSVKSKMVAWTS